MPRFTEKEKTMIQQKLLLEGERLFTLYGIKKVTVDDLVNAAGIAKGSFYAFYTNKEHLYMHIAGKLQEDMWHEMDGFLQENRQLPPIELTKQCFLWMFAQLQRYPMLQQANSEMAEYLYRKLPQEVIEAHTKEDGHALAKLQEYGITFTCGVEWATKILQTVAISLLNLHGEDAATQSALMNIMLDGILKEIVRDSHD